MKNYLFTPLILFILLFSNTNAQTVTISDPGMVAWLNANFPSAMSGNQMDTTNSAITNATQISSSPFPISNLNGIQYFDNLESLPFDNCSVDTIIAFPPNLEYIFLSFNNLTSLPALPNGLIYLNCQFSNLSSLPPLPNSLEQLLCGNNNLTNLPNLPSGLSYLSCPQNNLTMPSLPQSLTYLECQENNLTSLPILPNSLVHLACHQNNLTSLPTLPQFMEGLNCGYNNISSLPNLPESLLYLYCESNNLTSLPQLPLSLISLSLWNNSNLSCLPILPDSLETLYISSTNISCLPNMPSNLQSIDVQGLPLCQPNNTNGCITVGSISGAVFGDLMSNCINPGSVANNTTFHLFDDQGLFLESRSSSLDDYYYFTVQPESYFVRIDTSFSTNSVLLTCPPTGEHFVTVLVDSSYTDRDFGFQCQGADLGVEAIVQLGIAFPGQPHSVKALAGDLSNYFGLNCAAGTGGTVQLTVNGPVNYTGFPSSALVPTVSGNTYTYTISDFGTILINESFVLNFLTDITAQAGDTITITVSISSNSTDTDLSNNFLTYMYIVVNSFDPNMKVVNPVDVLPGYDDYFTYTVHFQNLGTAPSFNIKIVDTLDSNLDFSTFRIINTSHNYSYNLSGDLLNVYFPNIMLPDSASNPEGSKGFIQYQVKPKPNLPHGTTIENTAHIFFDYNPAIATNTTINAFLQNLSVAEQSGQMLTIYPNPSAGEITLVNQQNGNEAVNVRIYDLLGKELHSESVNFNSGVAHLNLNVNAGNYVLVVENETGAFSSFRVVVQK